MPEYDAARSAFRYEGQVIGLIKKFKTGGRYLAEAFAERMEPVRQKYFADADLLVSVPMTEAARKKRGYNQAALLASALARRCGVAYAPEALAKSRDTAAQKQLSAAERAKNLAGSFRVHERALCRGRHIVIVDDVPYHGRHGGCRCQSSARCGGRAGVRAHRGERCLSRTAAYAGGSAEKSRRSALNLGKSGKNLFTFCAKYGIIKVICINFSPPQLRRRQYRVRRVGTAARRRNRNGSDQFFL